MKKDTMFVGLGLFAVLGVTLMVRCAGASQKSVDCPSCASGFSDQRESSCAAPKDTKLTGKPLAEAIMERFKEENPKVDWEADEREAHAFVESYDNTPSITKEDQSIGHPYRTITARDVLTWKRETERYVLMGSRIFHSASELGSTVGVSCDMCHPHAANTHPETYPKYQTQLGRVVLLRDMINWCLEHPLRAKPMPEDDERLRALEAYIIAQRSGKTLSYGKH